MPILPQKLAQASGCEVRADRMARILYATDASIYQVEPQCVALPKTAQEASQVLGAAQAAEVAITPRGAGTGLAGGALGEGLILDCARYNREIRNLNVEARTVEVGAGVVLDQLNAYLKPHGLAFGPDVATSSRATFGGMIGNNSSGARTPLYGTTADHLDWVELVLADGRVAKLGRGQEGLDAERARVAAIVNAQAAHIRERFHAEINKRWPGYGLDRYLNEDGDLSRIIGGSEGTLGAVFSAGLRLVPLPKEKGIGIVFFESIGEAMEATVELLELQPAAIEHVDKVLFDQTRGQLSFQGARDLLELDTKPCTAFLIVEFYEDIDDRLAALEKKNLGLRTLPLRDEYAMAQVWNLRKSGLTLLTGCPGAAKPTAGIEDVAVPPARLPEYVAGLQKLFAPYNMEASFYGHAAAGLLHVRPVVDLHNAEDLKHFREIGEGVSALTKELKGSLAAEHGVGMARTEFMTEQLGPELLETMRAIKAVFDPKNVMNPGKIIPDGRYAFDTHLRWGAGYEIKTPFEPVLEFMAKDHSFVGNLEQCNGCGGCRKAGPTMCPTFVATGEDIMVTRGRANIIRAALDGRMADGDPLLSEELDVALSNCLSCKACRTECPSNVDLALLKAELLHAKYKKHGTPFATRFMSRVDLLGELASVAPGLANAGMRWNLGRRMMETLLGVAADRPLPPYAAERFDHWFAKQKGQAGTRGSVILWDDCFVRHNEPNIGQAAVRVLEAAGFAVSLVKGRACCGRPAFSMGRLDVARAMGETNAALLRDGDAPILFLEPSCYSMFSEDYAELGIEGADALSKRAMLFEHFIDRLLAAEPEAIAFSTGKRATAIHAHCHTKALADPTAQARLAKRIPGNDAALLNTGCCGMAGAFGAMKKKYELSLAVAKPLIDQLNALPPDTAVVASGTSCRHQIEHLSDRRPLHIAELLAEALR